MISKALQDATPFVGAWAEGEEMVHIMPVMASKADPDLSFLFLE